jgi:hypothetical protein
MHIALDSETITNNFEFDTGSINEFDTRSVTEFDTGAVADNFKFYTGEAITGNFIFS